VGHLFQGRYKAILCDRDAYLLELVRYLHLNPARIKRALDPWKYLWSSHRSYMEGDKRVRVHTAPVLKQFGSKPSEARRGYLGFMRDGLRQGHVERFYQTIEQRFLGDEQFIEEVEKKKAEPAKIRVKFSRLVEGVAGVYGIAPERLSSKERKRGWGGPRSLLVYAAREWCGIEAKVLAGQLNRDASMISRLYAAYADKRDKDVEVQLRRFLNIKSITQA
jgi:hypothetical protein